MTDNVTLPIQRLREAVSELIKLTEDKDTGQELVECNRRLAELREEVAMFLSQSAEDHVYWVERAGKAQKNLALNAAPVDVADFLRRRLFRHRHLGHHDQRHAVDFGFQRQNRESEAKTGRTTRNRRRSAAEIPGCRISSAAWVRRTPRCCRSARRSITSGR